MRSRAPIFLAATFLLSCSERQPSAPEQGITPPPATAPATSLQRLRCVGRVDSKVVNCALPMQDVSADVIVGGQGLYVKLTSSNVSYVAGVFAFDVTVQNLIPQSLGTTDGVTADAGGVKVFFYQAPTVLTGSGPISVANPDGQGSFTGSNQDYFAYTGTALGADAILVQNETSTSKTWQLNVDPGVASFEFAVYVSTNVRYPNGYVDATTPSPYLNQTLTQTVTATSRTMVGNVVPGSAMTYASTAPAIATVDPSTGEITAVAPGIATINVTSAESTTGSLTVQVCPNLAVGDVYTASGIAGQELCFGGGATVQEYTMMPMNSSLTDTIPITVTGSGIQAVTGPPTPAMIPSQGIAAARIGSAGSMGAFGDLSSADSHVGSPQSSGIPPDALRWLRARGGIKALHAAPAPEQREEEDGAATDPEGVFAAEGAPQRLRWYPSQTVEGTVAVQEHDNRDEGLALATTTRAVGVVGDLVNYNTTAACSGSPSVRTGMIRSISNHAVIVADTSNPPGGFTTAQYDSIAMEFDTIAYPVVIDNFGAPADLDDNGDRIILFYTRAVNELSPPASSVILQGGFYSKDVFGTNDCPNSSGQATVGTEILYMLVPDPTGSVHSNVRTVAFVRGGTVLNAGHELQHLVNGMRRAYITGASAFETGWLNEALSGAAQELMFYKASGMVPRSNVGPGTNAVSGVQLNSRRVAGYNAYQSTIIGKFRPWLQRPDTMGLATGSELSQARQGFGGTFIRYAADRANVGDATFFTSLVNSNLEGLPNLQNAIGGAQPFDWIRDFQIALYADDNPSFTVAPQYQTPSWNYRALYALLYVSYSLLARPMTNEVGTTLSYRPGGSGSYFRFGVPAAGFATITSATVTPAPLHFSWIRTK